MADHDASSEPELGAGGVEGSGRLHDVDPPQDPAASGAPAPAASLGAHSVVYLVGTALQGLGVLIVLPFATRALGATEFGRVATGLVVVQMVGTLAAAGLPQVILREHHRGTQGPRVARALAGTMILFALGLGVVGLALAAAISAAGHADLAQWVPLVLASAGLTTVVSGQTLMRARLQPWGFLALAVLSTVVAQFAGLLAARAEPTAGRYLTAYAGVVVVAALVAVLLGRPLWPTAERERVRAGVRLAAPLLPQAAAMLGLLSGDVLLTRWLVGDAATGAYQVALQLGNMPFVLAVALFNAWGPLVLSHPLDRRWQWTARTGTALTAVVGLGAAGVSLLGPWLVAADGRPRLRPRRHGGRPGGHLHGVGLLHGLPGLLPRRARRRAHRAPRVGRRGVTRRPRGPGPLARSGLRDRRHRRRQGAGLRRPHGADDMVRPGPQPPCAGHLACGSSSQPPCSWRWPARRRRLGGWAAWLRLVGAAAVAGFGLLLAPRILRTLRG